MVVLQVEQGAHRVATVAIIALGMAGV